MKLSCGVYKVLILFACLLAGFFSGAFAQLKKWDGGGGDGEWNTAANWEDDTVPSTTDDVLLDNSLLTGNYLVQLPAGSSTVVVRTVTIQPSPGNTIQLVLPITNTAIPAFTCTGPGYGMQLDSGAVFKNSSGASSGTAVVIADSLRINNGGIYIQNSPRTHASIVMVLSRLPGTERGTFKFDVPGNVSYTPTLNGRTYGNLELSAEAAGGTRTYLSAGSTAATIRGEYKIRTGVTHTLDFTATITVLGDVVINGTLNLANQPNNNMLRLRGNYYQSGLVTETSNGLPVIEWNGNNQQLINVTGTISNSVTIRINNPAGCTLQTAVSLPYKFELVNGIVTTDSSKLLTLQTGCSIQADSLSSTAFVNGPLRKEGLSSSIHFLFPVGKGNTQRWLALKNASGSYTVEFIKSPANALSSVMGPGIDHVSSIEHWVIEAEPGSLSQVELSFDNVNSGGITDLSTLRVAQLITGAWTDAGNAAVTGSAGSSGSVVSNLVGPFNPETDFFSLASSAAAQNPLPLRWIHLKAKWATRGASLAWKYNGDEVTSHFEIEMSTAGNPFLKVARKNYEPGVEEYNFFHYSLKLSTRHYRIKWVLKNGQYFFSPVSVLLYPAPAAELLAIDCPTGSGIARLIANTAHRGPLTIFLIDQRGQLIRKQTYDIQYAGHNTLSISLLGLQTGIYQVFGVTSSLKTNTLRFIRN